MSKLFITLVVAVSALTIGYLSWQNQAKPSITNLNSGATSSTLPSPPSDSSNFTPEDSSATIAPTTKDRSELDLALSGTASMLMTDSAGRRVGRDPVSGIRFEEIPNSSYFEDGLSAPVGRTLEIPQPEEGQYQVTITGLGTGFYQLSIRAFSRDGRPQPALLKIGNVTEGLQLKVTLSFSSTPGETSTLK